MDINQIVEQLRRLGMSGYEAKAYVTLVAAGGPLNGYEVAKRSGVPRSTVYETLGKLVARSAAFETTAAEGTTAYLALPPATLFSRVRDETEDAVERLQTLFTRLDAPPTVHFTQSLSSRADILARSQDLISSARIEMMMFVWPEELDALEPTLRRSSDSGTNVVMMLFGDDDGVGQVFRHVWAPPDQIERDFGCRLHMLVADGSQVVVAGLTDSDGWGILTDDPAITMVAREFIRYDIMSQQIIAEMSPEQRERAEQREGAWSFNERTFSASALLRRLVPGAESAPRGETVALNRKPLGPGRPPRRRTSASA